MEAEQCSLETILERFAAAGLSPLDYNYMSYTQLRELYTRLKLGPVTEEHKPA